MRLQAAAELFLTRSPSLPRVCSCRRVRVLLSNVLLSSDPRIVVTVDGAHVLLFDLAAPSAAMHAKCFDSATLQELPADFDALLQFCVAHADKHLLDVFQM